MTTDQLPFVAYVNKPSFPTPPSKQPYHLRKLNWTVPFTIPAGHDVVVKINDRKVDDFTYSSSVVTLKRQPQDYDHILITVELKDEDSDS